MTDLDFKTSFSSTLSCTFATVIITLHICHYTTLWNNHL